MELKPEYVNPYNNRGLLYEKKGEYDKAIADFTRALELNPKDEYAYYHRGYAYDSKGEYDKAITDRAKVVELSPKNAGSVRQLGISKFHAGDLNGAASDLLHALELNDDIYAMLFRYVARAKMGETIAAADLEANAGRLKTKEWPYAVIELYLGRRSPELTLDSANKPDQQCEAHFYTGEWYVLQNKPAQAEAALKKAVETCPKDFIEYSAARAELRRLMP
jgi:lipoprotein NlpI